MPPVKTGGMFIVAFDKRLKVVSVSIV